MWQKPNCNNCGSGDFRVFLKSIKTWEHEEKFNIVACRTCRLKFLSPRPGPQSISKYYSESGYWGCDLDSDKQKDENVKKLRHILYGKIYREILRLCEGKCIFDVGAGTGIFLTKFKDLGWKIDGIELSEKAVNYAKKNYDIDLRSGSFDKNSNIKNKFDVVTFNSSLEHLYDPKLALKRVHGLLKKQGILVITVPNIESLGLKFFKRNWLPLHPPKHLYHFSEKTLSNLLDGTGFVINNVSHWYFQHGFYGIFNSIRYMMSPKFKNHSKYSKNQKEKNSKGLKSIMIEAGKISASILACILVILGSTFRMGETITVYANKKSKLF